MTFVHLHNHSYYSLMDGFNSPEELILRAKELGQPAMAVTDHGTLSAHREFQAAGRKHGVKPILGVEAYISPTDRFDRSAGTDKTVQAYHHLILLAKNDNGLKNIMRLSEIAWDEGYYSKPRIDREILDKYGDDIVILSGCMNGLIAKAYLKEDPDTAERWAKWFSKRFGDDFYIELQYHNEPGLNRQLVDLARKYNIQLIATSDCHFARPEDRAAEEAMLVLSTSPKKSKDFDFAESRKIKDPFERLNYIYPERPISFEKIDVYVQERQEIVDGFTAQGELTPEEIEESCDNTIKVAEKVGSFTYHSGEDLLPKPKNDDPFNILEKRCWIGMRRLKLDKNTEYIDRLNTELDAIRTKGLESYFLVVGEATDWAKRNKILVGAGRGSAAGSLVCYTLGITNVDPIEHNLLFARFVNPGYVGKYEPRFEEV